MRKLYDAGYDAGLRAAEDKHYGAADCIDGTPSWARDGTHGLARAD
jgi:hypothetical protein